MGLVFAKSHVDPFRGTPWTPNPLQGVAVEVHQSLSQSVTLKFPPVMMSARLFGVA